MKIPFVSFKDVPSNIQREDLAHLIDFDPARFDQNRILLAQKFSKFMHANKVKVTSQDSILF